MAWTSRFAATLAMASILAASGCNRVSGEFRQANNPNNFVILKPDGTCQRDSFACKYSVDGKNITLTMAMMGIVFNATLDGDRLVLTEPGLFGGKIQTVFIRKR